MRLSRPPRARRVGLATAVVASLVVSLLAPEARATVVDAAPPAAPPAAVVAAAAAAGPTPARGRFNAVPPVVVRDAQEAALPGMLRAGVNTSFRITQGYGVPAVDVSAVVLQVNLEGFANPGQLRVGTPSTVRSVAPALVYKSRELVQNQVVVPLGAEGVVSFRSTRAARVGVFVVGWVDSSSDVRDLEVLRKPVRLLDTASRGPVTSKRPLVLDLRRRARASSTVTAVVANLSVRNPSSDGYVGIRRPGARPVDASVVSVKRKRSRSHLVVVPIDARGKVALSIMRGKTHLALDVVALVHASRGKRSPGLHHLASGARALDTRTTSRYAAGKVVPLALGGRYGVPAGATSVTATITAVGGRRGGDVRVAPHAAERDWTPVSVVTRARGLDPLVVTLPLGPTGAWTVRRSGGAHAVIDVVGWTMPRPTPARGPQLLAPVVRTSEPAQLAAKILASSSRYTMGTWWDRVLPRLLSVDLNYQARPGSAGRGFEKSVKNDPLADPARRFAMACFGLAANLATGTWDAERIGHGATVGLERLVLLLNRVAAGHLSQRVDGWGTEWQGALVGGYLGRAAWLVWDWLPASTRAVIAEIIAFEADDISGRRDPYLRNRYGVVEGKPGDSKAEEVSWQAMPVQLALAMLPGHDHRSAWMDAVVRRALGAWARPADVARTELVQGAPLTSWLGGSNVEPDGIVMNHNRVAPDYMALITQTLDQAWIQALVREETPQAARELLTPVYDAMTQRQFPAGGQYAEPGGTIYPPDSATLYYPQGIDWGTGMQLVYGLMDTAAAAYGVGDSATAARSSLLHLRAAAAMQDRPGHEDGRTYDTFPLEFNYVGREELLAQLAAQTMLTVAVSEAGLVSFSDAHWRTF